MSHQLVHPSTVRPEPAGSTRWAALWFGVVVTLFAAFWVLATVAPGSLETLWSDLRGLPPLVEAVVWLVAFPWAVSLAVWQSAWPDSLRALLLTGFTIGWSFAFFPRPHAGSD
jgi:hypothetical protein